MAKVNEQTEKKPDIKVRYVDMDDGEYFIELGIDDRHTSHDSWHYDHRAGYHTNLGIFDLSLDNIFNLALAIMQKAIQIQSWQKES